MLYLGHLSGQGTILQAVDLKNKALAALGIKVWEPRPFRHPQLENNPMLIVPEIIKIGAHCIVLLYIRDMQPHAFGSAQQKILDGMLSVLNLTKDQLMVVKVYGQTFDIQQVSAAMLQWQARSVLQLDMDMPCLELKVPIVRTYSPDVLFDNPAYKPQAYKDLLTLRNILHHGTS